MPSHTSLIDFWFAALGEPLGIYITSPDPIRLKGMLYSARAKHQREAGGNPTSRTPTSIDSIQIRTAPNDPQGTLWLVNAPQEAQADE